MSILGQVIRIDTAGITIDTSIAVRVDHEPYISLTPTAYAQITRGVTQLSAVTSDLIRNTTITH